MRAIAHVEEPRGTLGTIQDTFDQGTTAEVRNKYSGQVHRPIPISSVTHEPSFADTIHEVGEGYCLAVLLCKRIGNTLEALIVAELLIHLVRATVLGAQSLCRRNAKYVDLPPSTLPWRHTRWHKSMPPRQCRHHFRNTLLGRPNDSNTCLLYTSPSPRDS